MKKFLLILTCICISFLAKSQVPAGAASPKSPSGFAEYGYLLTDSAGIAAKRDTSWSPKYTGSWVYWQNPGVDSAFWVFNGKATGKRWDKVVIVSGSYSPGTGTVTAVIAGTGMNFSTITSSGQVKADTLVLSTRLHVDSVAMRKVNYTDTAAMLSGYAKTGNVPAQFNLSVNAPIVKSGTYPNITVSADTGRAVAELVTGGSLNKVRDSLQANITAATSEVSSFGFTNANGISGIVTNPTSTPNLTLSLGAITPTSVSASGGISSATLYSSGTILAGNTMALGGATIIPTTGLNMNSVSGTLGRGVDVQISGTSSDANYAYIGASVGAATGVNYGAYLRAENSSANNYALWTETGNVYFGSLPFGSAGTDSLLVTSGGVVKKIAASSYPLSSSVVKYTDTSSMLLPYLRKSDTAFMMSNHLLISDTANMLARGWLANRSKDSISVLRALINTKGAGTVTSVGLSLPSFITVSSSPITSSGTIVGTLATQTANRVFASATSGSPAQPTFRSLVAADLPDLSGSYIVNGNSQQTADFNISGNGVIGGKLAFASASLSDATLINASGGSTGYSRGFDLNINPTTSENRGISLGVGGTTTGTNYGIYSSVYGGRYNYSFYSYRGNQRFTDTTFMPDSGRIYIGSSGYYSTNTAVQVSRLLNVSNFPSNSAHAFSDASQFDVPNAPYASYDAALRFYYHGGSGSPHEHYNGFQFAPSTLGTPVYIGRLTGLYSGTHNMTDAVITNFFATVYEDTTHFASVPTDRNFLLYSTNPNGGRIQTLGALDISGKSYLRNMSNGSSSDSVVTVVNGELKKIAQTFGSGTVTSVAAGIGMSFTTITGSGSVNADTTVLSTKANVTASLLPKLNLSDTASMLSNRLKISDTLTMLSPYLNDAYNGLTKSSKKVKLGGLLTENTTITDSTFSMLFTNTKKINNSSKFGQNGELNLWGVTADDNTQLLYAGNYGSLSVNSAATYNPYYNGIYTANAGITYYNNAGNIGGSVPVSSATAWGLFANTGNIANAAGVHVKTPNQTVGGTTVTGKTTTYGGIVIDNFRDSSSIQSKFQNLYAINQKGAHDTSLFNGIITGNIINATTLGGTLSTAAQPNITSVGILSSINSSGALSANTGTFTTSTNGQLVINHTNTSGTREGDILFTENGTNKALIRSTTGGNSFAFYDYALGAYPLILSSTGTATFSSLAGSGSRAVLADASGVLSAPVSDRSVKENIKPLSFSTNDFMKLRPVSFTYKKGWQNYGTGNQIGFIAQEVKEVLPNSTFTTPSTGKMGYNEIDMIPVLVDIVQKQQKKMDELKAMNKALLQRIIKLENK